MTTMTNSINRQYGLRQYEHPSTEEIALDAPQLLDPTNGSGENPIENSEVGWD